MCYLTHLFEKGKSALFNVLCSTLEAPSVVCAIVDCTKDMAQGKKKDAVYIAHIVLRYMREFDPTLELNDCLMVDGAANVQNAGKIIKAVFLRVTTFHGAEHKMALYFSDISKIPCIKVSFNWYGEYKKEHRVLIFCLNLEPIIFIFLYSPF